MSKIKIKEGNREEMVLISQFLLKQGFTPVYPLEPSNWKDDQFGVHIHLIRQHCRFPIRPENPLETAAVGV